MIDNFLKKNLNKEYFKGTIYQMKNIRLTLDYKEDYHLIKKIHLDLGTYSHRKKINSFLRRNKQLVQINYFRNFDWLKKQKTLLEQEI